MNDKYDSRGLRYFSISMWRFWIGSFSLLFLLGNNGCGIKLTTATATDGIIYNGDGGTASCSIDSTQYPCGPYGTKPREIAANLEFQGYADPLELCKDNSTKVIDIYQLRSISFKDWYLAATDSSSACASFKKELLWVIVSAGWCASCQTEVQDIAQKYLQGQVDNRIGILNIVFEAENVGVPADELFIKRWINSFNVTFPVVMDPQFQIGAYFSKSDTPFNMLLETGTMKIYHQQTGADFNTLTQQINNFFKK